MILFRCRVGGYIMTYAILIDYSRGLVLFGDDGMIRIGVENATKR